MQTIAAQLNHARTALMPVAGDAAALEARVLAAHAWGMNAEGLVQHADTVRDDTALQQLLQRRLQHEPVSHILGRKDFWRDAFYVTADVLTPRADSETMIEVLLQHRPDKQAALRMLDLGTGSGCLLLSALREYPQATGVGADQSQAALAVAERNAVALGITADMSSPRMRGSAQTPAQGRGDSLTRCSFVRSNWCSNIAGQFDVVLANPPYIPTADIATLDADVRAYEPHTALDGGADGLDCYRSIAAQISPHLAPGALLLFEVGMGQAEDVAAIGQANGLNLLSITADLAGIPRIVALNYPINA